MAWRHNLLYAPHFPSSEPDLDAMGVVSRCRQDVLHDAAGELPAPLILLLRDAHLEPWLNICTMRPVHVVRTSFPCGRGNNAMDEAALRLKRFGKCRMYHAEHAREKHALWQERNVLDPACPPLPLSCTPSLAYTVCGKAGSINTDTRALVPQR